MWSETKRRMWENQIKNKILAKIKLEPTDCRHVIPDTHSAENKLIDMATVGRKHDYPTEHMRNK